MNNEFQQMWVEIKNLWNHALSDDWGGHKALLGPINMTLEHFSKFILNLFINKINTWTDIVLWSQTQRITVC